MTLLSLLQDEAVIRSLALLPVLALISAIGYFLFEIIYNLFFHPLRKFPGPKLWAMSNIPYMRMFMSGNGHYKIRQLHQQYGPIIRIGPGDLSINHPDGMRDLRGHRKAGTGGENPKDPAVVQFNADNIIGCNRQDHQRYRRAIAHGFSQQSMMDQEPIIKGYVDKFINGLGEVCGNGTKPVDIAEWYNFLSSDIIGDLAFGEPFGCLDNKELHPWIRLIFVGVKDLSFLSCLARNPWLSWLIMSFKPKSLNGSWLEHKEMSQDKVRKRLATKENRPDFINAMMKKTASGQEMSFEELASNAQILVLAGSETTATLLTATTYYLASNPEMLKKACDEVRSAFKSESEINMVSVHRLSYMLAALNESLRILPPAINGAPRKIREEGDVIIDQYIPGGASVDIWHWVVYHSAENFTLPDEYHPERWLDDPRFANDVKRALMPFSTGPRDCVGKNLAYAEMRLVMARMLWNFDIRLDPKSEGWEYRTKSYFIWEREPLIVTLNPRSLPDQL